MKARKVIKEINALISQIEGIVESLEAAASKLRAAQSDVEKDKTGVNTLVAVQEAHLLVQQAMNGNPHFE